MLDTKMTTVNICDAKMLIYPLLYALYYLQVLCTCCDFNVIPLVNFWIEENIEKGTFIGQLSSLSSSSSASVASLSPIDSIKFASTSSTCAYTSLAQQPISNYFHIDSNDGGIYALRRVDREALCSEDYVLERIRRHISDKTPKSGNLSHNNNNTSSIDENSNKVQHTVLSNNNQTNQESHTTVTVTTNATRHYRNVNHAVDISQTPATTATTASVCQIKFQVLISDTTGIKSKSNMLQNVQITISDLNDNIPQFNVQNFSLKIPESSPIDAEFRLPQANDMDTGVNGISEYRLVPCIHADVGDEIPSSYLLRMCHKQEMNLVQKYSETSVFIDLDSNKNIKRSSSSEYTEESLSRNYAGDYFMLKTNLRSDGKLQPILKQIRLLDREQVAWLYLCLVAVDGGGQQGFTCGYIEIIDANDNVPQWIDLPYRVSVSECEPDKQNIYAANINNNNHMFQSQIPSLRHLYTLKAKDSDSGIYGQITYRLAPSTMTGHKRLQHNQPKVMIKEDKLYLLSKLDYEQLTKFVVYVEAVDGGGLVNFTDVEVTVEDCNDHAPTIMLIPVRSSSRTTTTTTTTTTNINNKTYGISKTNIHSMLSFPVLPTSNMDLWMEEENYDQIKLATIMSFDRDKKDNGRVTCYLDKSGQFLDSFDYSQIFELLSNQPTINAISSSSISSTPTVTTDEDLSSSMKQTDIYGNITLTNKPSIFSLYKKSGIKVDREESQKLLFDIVCTDNGEVNPQITRRTVHVFIGDINDNPPQILTTNDLLSHAASSRDKEAVERPFISQVFSVPENEPFGTYVGTVMAKDIDEGINSKLLYSFISTSLVDNSVSESDSKDVFEIDRLTGRITTRVPLDRETQSSYVLNVQVMDSGEPPLSSTCYIQINVADVNDMPPIFETSDPSGRIVFQVTESVGNRRVHGRLVGRLKAYDNDLGSNQTIRFAFVNGSLFPNQLPVTYRISLDGHIYADGIMDREAYKEHQFTVIAVDGASTHHQLTSTAVVLVTLLDINDNPPQFIYPPSTTSNKIPSDLINITVDTSPGTILYSVRVTDLDEPQNTKITFALHSARFLSDYFTLKQNDVHISETDGYTEVNADLILVNSLTQLLPTYKVKHTRTGDSVNKKLTGEAAALPLTKAADVQQHPYPTEYFLYIIVKDSDKDSGFTSTARLRIHVYTESTSLYPLYSSSSSITSSRHRSNVSSAASELLQAKNFEMYKQQHSDGAVYSVDKFNTYGAELKDTGQLYQNKLVSHNNNNNNSNSNNMTVLLIVSIIIICIFIGVFCSVAIFYIRGNVANCQEVNRPRSSEIYTTTQPSCTDNWSVGELSEPCKTPSSWETLNCKDMTVTLSKVDENTLNNKSKTYILTQPVKYPNTELMNTLPMAFSPMSNRNHKVNFITTCPSDNNSEQIGMETVCVPNEQHYDLQSNNDSIHHIYSRLPANVLNSDTGEPHTTYLAPYYQELYHPTLKPTYKTILRTPGQQISTSAPANRISNLKTHQTNFNLLQKPVKNESVQLNTFMPKTSLNKTNKEKVLEVNFKHPDSMTNGENIYDAKSMNPSKGLDDKLISSLNDLQSCTVEGKTQFIDHHHHHQNMPTNNKILQPPLTPTQKSTYLLRSNNEQSECLECEQHKEQTSATSTL
ncbi:unnamed protein product [Trichobilharzia szidati]|nr:unnamed protein product [Trichobilharzia szidati]